MRPKHFDGADYKTYVRCVLFGQQKRRYSSEKLIEYCGDILQYPVINRTVPTVCQVVVIFAQQHMETC